MDTKKLFGLRIKELRKSKNLTQEKLAEFLGIDTPNLSRLENGLHFPQFTKIEKLAKIFDISLNELFNYEHCMDRKYLLEKIESHISNASDKELVLIFKFLNNLQEFKSN